MSTSRVYSGVSSEAIGMPASAAVPDVDPSARLGELFELHHQRLYRLARRMVSSGDEARDLVQDTFLRVASKPGGLPADLAVAEAWLVRVLVNICRDEWRRRVVRRRFRDEQGAAGHTPPHPEAALVAQATIWAGLRAMNPRRRAAIVMYELEGAPIDQIARLLGVSAVTVRWHLSRGRRELAALINRTRTP